MTLSKPIIEELAKVCVDADQCEKAEQLIAAVGNADALQTLRDAMLRHQLELAEQEGGEHPAKEVLAEMRARLEARKNSA